MNTNFSLPFTKCFITCLRGTASYFCAPKERTKKKRVFTFWSVSARDTETPTDDGPAYHVHTEDHPDFYTLGCMWIEPRLSVAEV